MKVKKKSPFHQSKHSHMKFVISRILHKYHITKATSSYAYIFAIGRSRIVIIDACMVMAHTVWVEYISRVAYQLPIIYKYFLKSLRAVGKNLWGVCLNELTCWSIWRWPIRGQNHWKACMMWCVMYDRIFRVDSSHHFITHTHLKAMFCTVLVFDTEFHAIALNFAGS